MRRHQRETTRLLLRRPHRTDLTNAVAIYGHPRDTPSAHSIRMVKSMLKGFIRHWWRHGFGYWTIELRDSGEIIGFGGLSHGPDRTRRVLNLYYHLCPCARGQGYAVEMARCALDHAARAMPGTPVVITIRPANAAAVRVAEKLGFEREPAIEINGVEYAQFRAPKSP